MEKTDLTGVELLLQIIAAELYVTRMDSERDELWVKEGRTRFTNDIERMRDRYDGLPSL